MIPCDDWDYGTHFLGAHETDVQGQAGGMDGGEVLPWLRPLELRMAEGGRSQK